MPITKICRNCGSEFKVPPCRAKSAYTCSKTCKYALHPKTRSGECTCKQCGKKWMAPVSRIKRGNGLFCSKSCRFTFMSSDPEQSARIKGPLNPMWNGGMTMHTDGYVYKRSPDHPSHSSSYVFEHRLVVEEGMRLEVPNHPFLIDGHLPPTVHVHHRDGDKLNNKPSNLMAMTAYAHRCWHNSGRLPEPWECWPNIHPGG